MHRCVSNEKSFGERRAGDGDGDLGHLPLLYQVSSLGSRSSSMIESAVCAGDSLVA